MEDAYADQNRDDEQTFQETMTAWIDRDVPSSPCLRGSASS